MVFPGWGNQLELSHTIEHTNVDLPEGFDMFNLINNLVILFPGKQQAKPREKS